MISIEELTKKTVPQLRSYAKSRNIDLVGANTKFEMLEVIGSFIPPVSKETTSIKKKPESLEKVAIYATKNLHWNGVGNIDSGYNIVSKEASEKWITHKAVRLATPEEVAKFYGKL